MHFNLLSERLAKRSGKNLAHAGDRTQNLAVSKSRSKTSILRILGIMVKVEATEIIKIDKKII